MNNLLKGKTALVTGGTAGIGMAIAKEFASQGAYVAIFGTNALRGDNVVSEMKALPGCDGASFYKVDVSSFSQVEEAIKQILSEREKVDILVNNAGITRDQLLMKMTEEDWDQVMAVNVKSCYNTCRVLTRQFLRAKKGKIINIGSVVGIKGNAGQVNYAASKAAMNGLTKALARELASRNIQVNCIAPGFISTPMTDGMTEEQRIATLAEIPLGRMGSPEEIAKTALFLASEMSDYITGQVIAVDGGMVM